mmetsp:Transcript_27446/g.80735  ORF Transcript_27446/g.80735 Transcript_27446/m.80735 type:complete len:134 (-) Transcript_27446:206-607(-)
MKKKLKVAIIWKGVETNSIPPYRNKTIMNKIHQSLPDKFGKTYPAEDKVYMTVTNTANSNYAKAIEVMNTFVLPHVGIITMEGEDSDSDDSGTEDSGIGDGGKDGKHFGILVDEFKGHSHEKVKKCVKKSANI